MCQEHTLTMIEPLNTTCVMALYNDDYLIYSVANKYYYPRGSSPSATKRSIPSYQMRHQKNLLCNATQDCSFRFSSHPDEDKWDSSVRLNEPISSLFVRLIFTLTPTTGCLHYSAIRASGSLGVERFCVLRRMGPRGYTYKRI
jgi:hypothetical protein